MFNRDIFEIPKQAYSDPNVLKQAEITESMFYMKDQMLDDANRIVNASQGHGFAAEYLSAGLLNESLIESNSPFRYVRADNLKQYGTNHQQVDLVKMNIKTNEIVGEFQQKFCKDADTTLNNIMNPKYDKVQYLVPDDQHSNIIKLAEQKKLQALQQGDKALAKRYELRIRNTKKAGLTYEESHKKIFRANQSVMHSVGKEALQSGIQGAKSGAVLGAGKAILKHGHDYLTNEQASFKDFAKNVAIDTSKATIHQAAIQSLGSVVKNGLKQTVLKDMTKEMATKGVVQRSVFNAKVGSGSVAIAGAVIDAGQVVHRFMTDDSMTKAELTEELGRVAFTSTGAYLGGIAGTIIPIPVLGNVIGSMVGYVCSNVVYQAVVNAKDSLGYQAVADARERRQHLEAMCLHALPAMRAYRMQLEAQIEQEHFERQQNILESFNILENALYEWNPDKVMQSMSKLCSTFGAELDLPFSNYQEFDSFMQDKNSVLKF